MLPADCGMKARDSIGDEEFDAAWKVALKILRYLNDNPNASDTIDGILEWWLLKQSICDEQNVVERALEVLVEQDLILCSKSADGRKHFYVNADRLAESRRLVCEAKDREA